MTSTARTRFRKYSRHNAATTPIAARIEEGLVSDTAWFTVVGILKRRGIRWPVVLSEMSAMGSRALYDHCDHNPSVEFHPSDVVNDASEIASQHAMMAINSAIARASSTVAGRMAS